MTTQRVQHAKDVNADVRVNKAIEYLIAGCSYEYAATQCGYGSRASCHNAVQRKLQQVSISNVEELRKVFKLRYDALLVSVWDVATNKAGQYPEKHLWAMDRVLKILEQEATLLNVNIKPEEAALNQNYVKQIVLVDGDGNAINSTL